MTGSEFEAIRTILMMSQQSFALMLQSAGPMTATDVNMAELQGASTISNAALNAAAERLWRVPLNYVPGPIN